MVLIVTDIDATCDFFSRILGIEKVVFGGGRVALAFGEQKINLHPSGNPYYPHADQPIPGSGDICLISATPLAKVIAHLKDCGVEIIDGPVARTGSKGPITSVYIRDPDGNLVEVSNYD